jgi:hypothetical protein
VSLLQLDPEALLELRQTGTCHVTLPEELFDLGGAGHYFRRIKSVAVTIPCIVGPYTSVNCTLKLLKGSIRTVPLSGDGGYARIADGNDPRFQDRTGSIQSIVTSSGQNDSGLFEVNLRDERYLPFEGAGVIDSEWELKLPHPNHQFDYNTISDVVLHIRYTARPGGDTLADAATDHLNAMIADAEAAVMKTRLFSVREEFPSEWAAFKRAQVDAAVGTPIKLTFRAEHYPYWSQSHLAKVNRLDVYARSAADVEVKPNAGVDKIKLATKDGKDVKEKLWFSTLPVTALAAPVADLELSVFPTLPPKTTENPITDLWIAVNWGGE